MVITRKCQQAQTVLCSDLENAVNQERPLQLTNGNLLEVPWNKIFFFCCKYSFIC